VKTGTVHKIQKKKKKWRFSRRKVQPRAVSALSIFVHHRARLDIKLHILFLLDFEGKTVIVEKEHRRNGENTKRGPRRRRRGAI